MAKDEQTPLYTLFKFEDDEGNFDYEKYARVQEAGNLKKIRWVWVKRETLKVIADYLKTSLGTVSEGICHGTRRGREQKWLAELTGANVIGTEISKTATQFPNTVQHDFHEFRVEWYNKFDFVYSNAFDHSYDPKKAINAWMGSLKDTGFCFIEHTYFHSDSCANELDPFGACVEIMPYLILKWGQGKFFVCDILISPVRAAEHDIFVLVIKKNT